MRLINWGSMLRGIFKILNRDMDIKVFLAFSTLFEFIVTYVSRVIRVIWGVGDGY